MVGEGYRPTAEAARVMGLLGSREVFQKGDKALGGLLGVQDEELFSRMVERVADKAANEASRNRRMQSLGRHVLSDQRA